MIRTFRPHRQVKAATSSLANFYAMLRDKFHIHTEVVRRSTIARLDRSTPQGRSLYEYFRHLIISIDFAKTDRHRPLLLQDCPDLVIVDEAHSAADPGHIGSKDQQQRHALVKEIASDESKHLLLLTATPHKAVSRPVFSRCSVCCGRTFSISIFRNQPNPMIRFVQGNLLDAQVEALVNAVNTVGVMGKGIALMSKEAFPENFRAYEIACKRREVGVGRTFVTETSNHERCRWIINFPTKKHWRNPSRLEWIIDGLQDLRHVIRVYQLRSIALPALGTGNGGLDWSQVRAENQRALGDLENVDVFVYEPGGNTQTVR